jgi:hypothetical protein
MLVSRLRAVTAPDTNARLVIGPTKLSAKPTSCKTWAVIDTPEDSPPARSTGILRVLRFVPRLP